MSRIMSKFIFLQFAFLVVIMTGEWATKQSVWALVVASMVVPTSVWLASLLDSQVPGYNWRPIMRWAIAGSVLGEVFMFDMVRYTEFFAPAFEVVGVVVIFVSLLCAVFRFIYIMMRDGGITYPRQRTSDCANVRRI